MKWNLDERRGRAAAGGRANDELSDNDDSDSDA